MRPVLKLDERRLIAVNDVAFVEQQFGEIGAVLAGHAGDQGDFLLAQGILVGRS